MKADLLATENIEPCPLCASAAFLHTTDINSSSPTLFWVKCDNLQCSCTITATKDRTSTLARWNERLHEISRVHKTGGV